MSGRTTRSLVLEGLVIVASILLAFGLEAWWESRGAREELFEDLANVGAEMEANLQELTMHLFLQRSAVASVEDFVERLATSEDWITLPDTVFQAAALFTPTFDPSTGALDALIADGTLSRLRDSELKGILTGFRTEVADVREDEQEARRVAHDRIMPLLWDDDAILPVFRTDPNIRFGRGLDETALPSVPVRIRNVPGLRSRLLFRRGWLLSAVRELEALEIQLQRASQLLQSELDPPARGAAL